MSTQGVSGSNTTSTSESNTTQRGGTGLADVLRGILKTNASMMDSLLEASQVQVDTVQAYASSGSLSARYKFAGANMQAFMTMSEALPTAIAASKGLKTGVGVAQEQSRLVEQLRQQKSTPAAGTRDLNASQAADGVQMNPRSGLHADGFTLTSAPKGPLDVPRAAADPGPANADGADGVVLEQPAPNAQGSGSGTAPVAERSEQEVNRERENIQAELKKCDTKLQEARAAIDGAQASAKLLTFAPNMLSNNDQRASDIYNTASSLNQKAIENSSNGVQGDYQSIKQLNDLASQAGQAAKASSR